MSDKDDLEEFGLGGAERVAAPAPRARKPAQISGDEEILGEQVELGDEILGMLGKTSSAAFQKALTQRAPVLRKVQPQRRIEHSVEFAAVVQPGSTTTIQMQPGYLFRGTQLVNHGDTVELYISGLFVGSKPQLPTFRQPISVASVLNSGILLDTCDPALFISMRVVNKGKVSRNFKMTIEGHGVQ